MSADDQVLFPLLPVKSIASKEGDNKKNRSTRRRKFTVGIIVAETAGCVSDISVQFNTFLYYTSYGFMRISGDYKSKGLARRKQRKYSIKRY